MKNRKLSIRKKRVPKRKEPKKIYKGTTSPNTLLVLFAVLVIFLGGGMFLTRDESAQNPGNTEQPQITSTTQINTGGLFPLTDISITGLPNIPINIDDSCKLVTNDIILVVDQSGSMRGAKLAEAKESAKIFTELITINPASRVGLVVFDKTSNLLSPLSEDATLVKEQIDKISEKPYTCIQCGILTANQEMNAKLKENTKRSIVLLSDGIANHVDGAPSDTAKQAALAEIQKGNSETAISYYTIAIGKDAQVQYMQEIAGVSGGVSFATGESTEKIEEAFTQAASNICK
jgi:uncharacterized protein YegL